MKRCSLNKMVFVQFAAIRREGMSGEDFCLWITTIKQEKLEVFYAVTVILF